jgi:radical SAM superfamily enzyme YgiQ (UPF0313 family)
MHVALVGAEFEENLAVRYLLGALDRAGCEVTSILFNDESEVDAAAEAIVASGAAITGLSMVFTYRAREFARLATRARELGYEGHVIAGGHFAAMHPAELLRDVPAIDSVAVGEGEEIMEALALGLDRMAGVRGLVWRDGGRVVHNPPAKKPPELDKLAWPPRKSPFDHYVGIPITNILSSRGCSRNCAFCSIAAWHRLCGGDRLRLRSPAHVAEEMAWLYRQGVRTFNFHDDNFVLDDKVAMIERLEALGKELERRGVMNHIAFAIKCRPDVVDEELFSALVAMGLFRVFLGVEAGTPASLRNLGRGQTVEDNERALSILQGLDVHTCFNLLVFNPDSTLEDFAGNVAFLRRHPHNAMNFCRTEIYAGTPLEAKLRKQGRLLGDYWGLDYVMVDPRAQTAFEIVFPAFEARNYGDEGLHHLTMQIDYEQQLLRRFFGPHGMLRRRVKEQIVRVNLNTCDHLEEVVRVVPGLDSIRAVEAYGREIRQRVEADNEVLGREVQALLDEIRWAPLRVPEAKTRKAWVRAAATAGLAAAVTLAFGCREKSHATEMAAAPPQSTSGPPPKPDGDAVEEPREAEQETPAVGPPALIKPTVSKHLLGLLSKHIVPAQPVELEIWIDAEGEVSKVIVQSPTLESEVRKEIEDKVRELRFEEASVRQQRFLLYFAKEELGTPKPAATPTATPVKTIPPHPEMAPRPPPPPRPEMAPMPPKMNK